MNKSKSTEEPGLNLHIKSLNFPESHYIELQ